jgi:hypothetical protein
MGVAQGVEHHEVVDDALVAHRGDGTPASRSLFAYASPSSRSTSASPVMTSAGGSPVSWPVVRRAAARR